MGLAEGIINYICLITFCVQASAKNKDGNGNKRKNRNYSGSNPPPPFPLDGESPTSDYHSQNGAPPMVGGVGGGGSQGHFSMVEECLVVEEQYLNGLFNAFAQVRKSRN